MSGTGTETEDAGAPGEAESSEPAAPRPMPPISSPLIGRRRLAPLVLLAIAAIVLFVASPQFPQDQKLRVVLGELAPRVVSLDLDYLPASAPNDEPTRAATFHWNAGAAPRIVEHAPRFPNGRYRVGLVAELANPADRLDLSRDVTFDGNEVSLPLDAAR